jgi:hypothetical protein
MDNATYAIERARARVIRAMREQAAEDGETTQVYDLSVALRRSKAAQTTQLMRRAGMVR